MHKSQLNSFAQRNNLTMPSYSSIKEGPDHDSQFKAIVTFNDESFESPGFCKTLRQAEDTAGEFALTSLSQRSQFKFLATGGIMDETFVSKNSLQEVAQMAGIRLPSYSMTNSGPMHMQRFTSTVKLAGMTFIGDSATTKKQAEKNAAKAAWISLRQQVVQHNESIQQVLFESSGQQLRKAIAQALNNAEKESCMKISPRVPDSGYKEPTMKQRIRLTPVIEPFDEKTVRMTSVIEPSDQETVRMTTVIEPSDQETIPTTSAVETSDEETNLERPYKITRRI